jgi:hypothetical protein
MIWRHSHVVLGLAVKLGVFKLVCRHSLVPSVYFEVIVHTSARAPHPSAKKPESVMSHRSWVHLLPTVSYGKSRMKGHVSSMLWARAWEELE